MSKPSASGVPDAPAVPDAAAVPARGGVRSVACPRCGKSVVWSSENRFRPFCSQRCRVIDLGGWAAEAYRVPENARPADESSDES